MGVDLADLYYFPNSQKLMTINEKKPNLILKLLFIKIIQVSDFTREWGFQK
jgi:hypothetical protein